MYQLRELERKDLERINRCRNDPDLIALLGAPFRFINLDVDVAWFENYMRNRGNTIRCAIVRQGEDKILGLVTLASIDYLNQSAEFHIMIGDPAEQGHGAGTFAVQSMLRHAFYNMNLHRVELTVLAENQRAQHVYEKCGFHREGAKRQSHYKSGRFHDMYCYAVLKDEFVAIDKETPSSTRGGRFVNFNITEVTEKEIKLATMLHFDPYFQHSVVGRSDFQEVFQRIDTCARFFVAHRAQPLGYVAFYCNDLKQQSAYLTMIGVAKASQHQGIGSRLLQEVEDVSRRYGMRTLGLEVWKDNENAQEFYRSHGFAFLPKESETSFFMEKVL